MDPMLLSFTLVAGLLTLTPGADTMLVLRNVLSGGRSSGMATTVGICSGLFVHATLSALGLSVILQSSAAAYEFVKTLGAAYLIFLGVKSLWQLAQRPAGGPASTDGSAHLPHRPPVVHQTGRSYREGLLNNLLNPKVAVFYLAFLPQFIRPGDVVLAKSLLMAGIHAVEGLLWLGFLSLVLDRGRTLIQTGAVRRWLEGISGIVLVGLGVRLFFERR
jgi:RhtB (resistance to homoserine/threonine) family protein